MVVATVDEGIADHPKIITTKIMTAPASGMMNIMSVGTLRCKIIFVAGDLYQLSDNIISYNGSKLNLPIEYI